MFLTAEQLNKWLEYAFTPADSPKPILSGIKLFNLMIENSLSTHELSVVEILEIFDRRAALIEHLQIRALLPTIPGGPIDPEVSILAAAQDFIKNRGVNHVKSCAAILRHFAQFPRLAADILKYASDYSQVSAETLRDLSDPDLPRKEVVELLSNLSYATLDARKALCA